MPTKDELEAELATVTRERDELRAAVAEQRPAAPANYRPTRPFLSEGERQELEQYGVTNSPFTGEQITASGENVEPRTATARRADERAADATRERADVIGLDRIPVDEPVAPGRDVSPAAGPRQEL